MIARSRSGAGETARVERGLADQTISARGRCSSTIAAGIGPSSWMMQIADAFESGAGLGAQDQVQRAWERVDEDERSGHRGASPGPVAPKMPRPARAK